MLGCSDPEHVFEFVDGSSHLHSRGPSSSAASHRGSGFDRQAPTTLGEVITQSRYAFQKNNAQWRTGASGYDAVVEGSSFSITPRHHLRERSEPQLVSQATSDDMVRGHPATFSTVAVSCGQWTNAAEPAVTRAAGGHLEIRREEVTEYLRNGPHGIEQSWKFELRPPCADDLVVRVSVEGQAFSGRTETGLHFVDTRTGVGLRYDHGTWIDGDGAEHAIQATWSGSAIELRVPASIVERSRFPAVLDPVISAEFGMDNPVLVPERTDVARPELAFDGTNYIAVWTRQGYAAQYGTVYMARVSPGGRVIDAPRKVVASQSFWNPDIACSSTNCLIVWSETGKLLGRRVDLAGQFLDASPMTLATTETDTLAITSDGTNYLVVWHQEPTAGSNFFGVRVDANGQPIEAAPFMVSQPIQRRAEIDATFDGSNYVVVWSEPRTSRSSDIFATRVTQGGTVLDANGTVICDAIGEQASPKVAMGPTYSMIVWKDSRRRNHEAIYGARYSTQGTVVDADGLQISNEVLDYPGVWDPDIAFDGTQYVVAWGTDGKPHATRVSPQGVVSNPRGALGINIGNRLLTNRDTAMASNGTNSLVVWDAVTPSLAHLFAARVDTSGTLLDPSGFVVDLMNNEQFDAKVASDGESYFVVWADARHGNAKATSIYGVRVDGQGTILDAPALLVGQTQTLSFPNPEHIEVSVAAGEDAYLVVWRDRNERRAVRVSHDGSVLDPTPLHLSGGPTVHGERDLEVAYGNGRFLVVWTEGSGIYGKRITERGDVEDSEAIAFYEGPRRKYYTDLTFGAYAFYLVWSTGEELPCSMCGIRIDQDGAPIDASPVALSRGSDPLSNPEVSFNGDYYLVTWRRARPDSATGLLGVRVERDNTVFWADIGRGDFLERSVDVDPTTELVFDGSHHQLLWSSAGEIYGTRIGPAPRNHGLATRTSQFNLYNERYDLGAAIAPRAPGQFLLAYDSDMRIQGRHITYDAPLTALYQTFAADEDTSHVVRLEGFEPNGRSVHYSIEMPPTHGTLAGTPPDLIYTPDANYAGEDQFVFTVSNSLGDSDSASVWITVRAVPEAPIAHDDEVTTPEDRSVEIDVLANDIDPDGQRFDVTEYTQPTYGSVFGGNGDTLRYEPEQDFIGTDSFTYTITDPDGESNSARVRVTVTPVGDAPYFVPPTPASGSTLPVDEGETVRFEMAAVDPENTPVAFGVDPLPRGASIDEVEGGFIWPVDWRHVGEYHLRLVVVDADGDSQQRPITVVVRGLDSDGDGLNDTQEEFGGLDPDSADTDGDGVGDSVEWGDRESPRDTDSDGQPDALEQDSDNDGIADGEDACRLTRGFDYDGCELEDEIGWSSGASSPGNRGCGCQSSGDLPVQNLIFVLLGGLALAIRRRAEGSKSFY